ncbi:MAG: signal recognition particle protein [Deltaproteobacteria bacterium]|nr:signal recognition particle protein [Deltaproteobacteria bacterium]
MFDSLSDRLTGAIRSLTGKTRLSEKNIDEVLGQVRTSLLEADVNFHVVRDLVKRLREKSLGTEVPAGIQPSEMFLKLVFDELVGLLGGGDPELNIRVAPPAIILMVGLQGSGKTTSTGKLARHLRDDLGRKPYLVPADVYRPAAVEQLKTLGRQLGVPVHDTPATGADPVAEAQKAVEEAQRQGYDTVLVDTAGRLQIDDELMQELDRLQEVLKPHEILFVADAMTGQEAVNVVKEFHDRLDLDGVILTKMDGDARGGAALSIKSVTGTPVKFVGVGEKLDALQPFHPNRIAQRILGMGDLQTLAEKAQRAIDQQAAQRIEKKLFTNEFNLDDFREAMVQMNRMGSFSSLVGMIPGLGGMFKQAKQLQGAEAELKKTMAIINSMTIQERNDHTIINGNRRKRIAAGSGTNVNEVNKLLKNFVQMKKMMKQFSKMGPADMMRMMRQGPGGM